MSSEADGYVFVKGCDSCPLNTGEGYCSHPAIRAKDAPRCDPDEAPSGKAHPDCPLRKHSLHIALETSA